MDFDCQLKCPKKAESTVQYVLLTSFSCIFDDLKKIHLCNKDYSPLFPMVKVYHLLLKGLEDVYYHSHYRQCLVMDNMFSFAD